MNDPVNSLAAAFAAFGTLLAGIGAILPILLKRNKSTKELPVKKRILRCNFWQATVVTGLVTLGFGAGFFAGPVYNHWRIPLNMQITKSAWDALNRGDFASAITIAQECIARFGDEAHEQQTALAIGNAPSPPVGPVLGNDVVAILKQGLLNDVATCLYIQGQAAERLMRPNEAKQRYREVVTYSYARVWDHQGFVWSPSEVAAERLQKIGQ